MGPHFVKYSGRLGIISQCVDRILLDQAEVPALEPQPPAAGAVWVSDFSYG